jgi:O-succinylbenzoic acid--CoA ligase
MTETVSHFAVKNLSMGESCFSLLPDISISLDHRNCLVVHAPKLNQERLVTNDVIMLLSSKKFIWLGRYDNIINSGGIKIHPEELEKQIENQVNLRYFISSVKDNELGEKVVLIIEGKKINIGFDWGEIDSKKQPKSIIFMEKFIETKNGKINRKKTTDLLNLNIT